MIEQIVARTRAGLAARQVAVPLHLLERRAAEQPPPRDFTGALRGPDLALIAEVKQRSPSQGLLRPALDPAALARAYAAGGAAAISVLTEPHFFGGSLEHLAAAKDAASLPVLRKDFLLEPYQLWEARAFGADAALLIAAILEPPQVVTLLALAQQLGLAALVEVHDEAELARALKAGAAIIGINHRNLRSLEVDLGTTERLRPLVPADRIVVSESGIRTAADVRRLRQAGVQAVLVAEALVRATDPATKIRELLAP